MYLYDIIFNTLEEEILNHEYEFGAMLPSENQLCKRFSVERTTVRKALSMLANKKYVEKCPGIGSRVIYRKPALAAAGELRGAAIGFFIMESAQSNKKITEPYYADLFYYLDKECAAHDMQLIYTAISETSDIAELISKHDFIAAVFVTRTPEHLICAARKTGVPILTVNDDHAFVPCIQHDYLNGSYSALRYLYDMGHRHIALISGPAGFLATDDKMTGCYKAMHKFGLAIPPEWIRCGQAWTFQSGYELTQSLLAQPGPKPTALFVFNDIMAVGAIRAIHDAGLQIPDDISVVGFDNMEQLQFTEPHLTTVDGNTAYLAKVIVDTAFKNAFDQYDMGVKFVIPTKLVVRGTVRRIGSAVPEAPASCAI